MYNNILTQFLDVIRCNFDRHFVFLENGRLVHTTNSRYQSILSMFVLFI